jgi:MFS family permease
VISFDSTMARKIPPDQKGRAFGVKAAIGTSGLFFGPIVGGLLFNIGGLQLPMIIITVLGGLGLFLYFCILPSSWFRERNEILASGATIRERYLHFWENQILGVLMSVQMMTFILIGILFLAVPEFLSSYFRHHGVPHADVGGLGRDEGHRLRGRRLDRGPL